MTEVTRGFCWHQHFVPRGCLPLTCGYIHLLNHEKMCIKSEVEEILFKLATNDNSDEAFLLTSNFGPNGLSAPTLGLCLNFFSSITAHFNISSALRWAIQDQWSSGYLITSVLKYKPIYFIANVTNHWSSGYLITSVLKYKPIYFIANVTSRE